jgi:hypothetical protein
MTAPAPSPVLVPPSDDGKYYGEIVKQTEIPVQYFVGEDEVLITLPIPLVFVATGPALWAVR